MAGAEGLEPSARGFGVGVDARKAAKLLAFLTLFGRFRKRPRVGDAMVMMCGDLERFFGRDAPAQKLRRSKQRKGIWQKVRNPMVLD